MKLKEFPLSFYETLRLKFKTVPSLLNRQSSQVPVVVSLTTIPSRLKKVSFTIRSILDGNVLPKKIVLWLPHKIKSAVPKALTQLEGDIFSIHFTHLTCSHKKLVGTLKLYPEAVIVTCDDDFMYRKRWIEALYGEHLKHPKSILANHIRMITYDANGQLKTYKKWHYDAYRHQDSPLLMSIGAKGVLYPPNVLDAQVFNEKLFLKLTPKADDLWFKAMALLKHTPYRLSEDFVKEPIPIAGTQAISLKKDNVEKDLNSVQWNALVDYFGFLKKGYFN